VAATGPASTSKRITEAKFHVPRRSSVKARIALLIVAGIGFLTVQLWASGQAGVYGVVERVVLEPATGEAERIQVWGAFALVEHMPGRGFTDYAYRQPTRGYLYFKLPTERADVGNVRREWADLKSVAGTRQAVAFAYWDRFQGHKLMRIRPDADKPADPDIYYTNVGVVKLGASGNHTTLVSELLRLTAR